MNKDTTEPRQTKLCPHFAKCPISQNNFTCLQNEGRDCGKHRQLDKESKDKVTYVILGIIAIILAVMLAVMM